MLKPIVIDGSNVALSHGNNLYFSCKGIRICVEWFKNRGHKEIKVFVPSWRKENTRSKNPIKNQEILFELEREDVLVFTPSRWICDKRIICYDDRYILKFAADIDGVVVSNDNYRDIIEDCNEFKKIIKNHVLMYSFINDKFMPPDDPLGRQGPTLDEFLKIQVRLTNLTNLCPYEERCTYGHKCKYLHTKDDSSKKPAKHSLLRKTVSAPPYLDRKISDLPVKHFPEDPFAPTSNSSHTTIYKGADKLCLEDISRNDIQKKGEGYGSSFESDATVLQTEYIATQKLPNKIKPQHNTVHKTLIKTESAPPPLTHQKLTRLSLTLNEQGQYSEIQDCLGDVFEIRKKMQFHLSNIFPKENVELAFKKLPYETDPNTLCEALLALNKSKQEKL